MTCSSGLSRVLRKSLGISVYLNSRTFARPMGLPIERDLHFKPTPLEKIAPRVGSGKRIPEVIDIEEFTLSDVFVDDGT